MSLGPRTTVQASDVGSSEPRPQARCRIASNEGDLGDVRRLWNDFRAWLAVRYAGDDTWVLESYFDESSWKEELASLPGVYDVARGGVLLVASVGDRAVGTVALRTLDGERCEMKRMFVSQEARGLGVGDLLVDAVLAHAGAMTCRGSVTPAGVNPRRAAPPAGTASNPAARPSPPSPAGPRED